MKKSNFVSCCCYHVYMIERGKNTVPNQENTNEKIQILLSSLVIEEELMKSFTNSDPKLIIEFFMKQRI